MIDDLADKQIESLACSIRRINIWEGAVRSGKTVASILRWVQYAAEAPDGMLFMGGKTERTLKQNILDPMKDILGNHFNYSLGLGEATLLGRKIYLAGANDERSESKIRGLTLAGAYGDELTLWPESFFKMLLSRISVAGAKIFGTTNPDSPFHWIKTDYLDRKDELEIGSWSFNIDDNPFLDPEYVAALKKEYTGLYYRRFILGLWVLAEGAVHDMWNEDKHVVRELPRVFKNFIVGCDYGTANPCTFGLYGFDDPSRIIKVAEYFYDSKEVKAQKTDGQYGDDFERFISSNVNPVSLLRAVYIDPSAASFSLELQRRGFPVREANNDVLDGIRFVGKKLSAGEYLVHESCVNTRKEFASYVWDANAQKKGEDKPAKVHDHTQDSDRYALFSHFGNYAPFEAAGTGTKRTHTRMRNF